MDPDLLDEESFPHPALAGHLARLGLLLPPPRRNPHEVEAQALRLQSTARRRPLPALTRRTLAVAPPSQGRRLADYQLRTLLVTWALSSRASIIGGRVGIFHRSLHAPLSLGTQPCLDAFPDSQREATLSLADSKLRMHRGSLSVSFSLLPRPQNYPELRSIFSWGGNGFISENLFSIHI